MHTSKHKSCPPTISCRGLQAIEEQIKESFAKVLFKQLWDTKPPQHLVNGFRGAGIWPHDRSVASV